MGNIVLGRQVVSTGPCTNPTQNFQEIARVLEAMGNPSYDPGDGPIAIIDGVPAVVEYDVVNPLYYKDGDVVREDENGVLQPVIIGEEGGVGTLSSTVRYYLKVKGHPSSLIDQSMTEFTLTDLTVLETLRVHVPYVEGTAPTVPDITSDSITVQNNPALRVPAGHNVTARYNHVDGKWYPDSLDNWEEHARAEGISTDPIGQNEDWDQTQYQVLGHAQNKYGLGWLQPTILVRVGSVPAMGSVTNAIVVKWNGSAWDSALTGLFGDEVETVTVHNRSLTKVDRVVEMVAVLVGDQYVLSWPDMSGMPGHEIGGLNETQVLHHRGGLNSYQVGGEECD